MYNIALRYFALVLAEYLVQQCLFIQKYIFIMGYKCAVVGCRTGYQGGEKHSTFFFPKYLYLKEKWEKFVNRKDWHHTNYSVICAKHFDNKYIKEGKKRKLRWELQPIPTINSDYAILLRYTSYQSHKILLEQFSLPLLSLIKKTSTRKSGCFKVCRNSY